MAEHQRERDFKRQRVAAKHISPVLLEKWPGAALDEGFVPFPKRLLRALSPLFGRKREVEHLAVLLAVVDYKRPMVSRPPSVEFLAFLAGLEEGRFRKRLRELEERGWVTAKESERGIDINIEGFLRELDAVAPVGARGDDSASESEP